MTELPKSNWSERSRLECDVLTFFSISKKWWKLDTGLFATKWFDYRFLHPVQATYLYAEAYEKAWSLAFTENFDGVRGPYVKVFKNKDVFSMKGATLTGLWKGRQVADAIGIPYDVFCNLAFKETLRYWKRRHMPQPCQIYSERVVEAIVEEKWPELQEARLFVAQEPEYLVANYAGTQAQNDHHEWLFVQAEMRGNADQILARFIYQDKLLPEEKAKKRLGIERLMRIQQEA